MESKLIFKNGNPIIKTSRRDLPFYAYVTYFTENECYSDMARIGVHLYSICCYFSSMPINPNTGFTPAKRGIFDEKGKADFSDFDYDVHTLLEKDPEALFFPRIYITMPEWWVRENPKEVIPTDADPCGREMLFSSAFLNDGTDMLRAFMSHVKSSDYADALIGWQISGGATQEWFHFDMNGSFSQNAYPYFLKYMEKNSEKSAAHLSLDAFTRGEYAEDFARFANESVADTIEHFASISKSECEYKQIVGTFYGYSLECFPYPACGTFALEKLIDSPNIDFFSSPFSYNENRRLGMNLSYMIPYGSLKLHKKAYIVEADIRTHLSRFPDECRRDIKIKQPYRSPIWLGEPTAEGTVYQLRRAFAKSLTGGVGLWWFDMWGGWYASSECLGEFKRFYEIVSRDFPASPDRKERAAVIIDEKLYRKISGIKENIQQEFLKRAYTSGYMIDAYISSDMEYIRDKYDVFFFPQPNISHDIECTLKKEGKHYLFGSDISVNDICTLCKKVGLTPLTAPGDVVYEGNGFIALHALSSGQKTITLPHGYTVSSVIGHEIEIDGKSVSVNISKHDTCILRKEIGNQKEGK